MNVLIALKIVQMTYNWMKLFLMFHLKSYIMTKSNYEKYLDPKGTLISEGILALVPLQKKVPNLCLQTFCSGARFGTFFWKCDQSQNKYLLRLSHLYCVPL